MIELLGSSINSFVVFGTGEVCGKVIPLLEKKCHILCCADNDQRKWDSSFGKYNVKSPEIINDCDCDIIIAVSNKYEIDIIRQLVQMGVSKDRIYLCRQSWTDHDAYKIYPLNVENIRRTDIPLIQYDLFHAAEEKTSCRKVMILCSFFSVYAKQLIENISRRYIDIEFSLLTSAREYQDQMTAKELRHIYYYKTLRDLKTILEQLPVYDAMQLLWIEDSWVYCCRLIRTKTKKLNLNVGGSDFYRASVVERDYKRKLIEQADCITAETEQTVQNFKEYYGSIAQKTGLLSYGMEVLDFIKKNADASHSSIKKKFGLPEDKIIVTCGHNANRAHQHKKIIEAIGGMCESVKRQLMFVFPMTYGSRADGYISEVSDALQSEGLEYTMLTKFMDFQEMAEYAIISDIMTHVQTTDQLSATMLEEMFAGSIVIAGSWLPYHSLHEMGIYFLDIDTISDVTRTLQEVVFDIGIYKEKCAGNKEIIRKNYTWDEQASKWHALWE